MQKTMYKGRELLSPKNDLVFKAIFGAETDKEVLADFLSVMLELEIEEFEFFNSEISAEYDGGKNCRLDLRVKTTNNEHINVEIQLLDEKNMLERVIVYNCNLVTAQLKSGMAYSQLGRVISLIIVDFNLFKGKNPWYNVFKLKNCATNEEMTDLVQFAFIELPKLADVEYRAKAMEKLDNKEQWALFLATNDSEVLEFLEKDNAVIERAVKKLVYISEDEKMRFLYDMQFKAELDAYNHELFITNRATEAGLEIGWKKGMEKGLEEGIEKGLEEGIEKGLEEGREQGLEQGLEQGMSLAAQKMKNSGIEAEVIAECTGLTLEQIAAL